MNSSRKLRIGISTLGGGGWLGGVNYTINLVQALAALPKIKRPSINLIVRENELPILDSFRSIFPLADKVLICAPITPTSRLFPIPNIESSFRYIDFLYPVTMTVLPDSSLPAASWIPDFQHKHLPNFFSHEEIRNRDHAMGLIARKAKVVVFSSKTAMHDFETFFPSSSANKYVLRFVSTIDQEWFKVNPEVVARKHGIKNPFFICCNQFWAHKDHLTAFKAMKYLKNQGIDIKLLCTGTTRDYRAPDYFSKLKTELKNLELQETVFILGKLPRDEQVALIRGSLAIIQPSLFEGWSTVVEDAKSLNKPIFLSDIPVHREQISNKAFFFEPKNFFDLHAIIEKNIQYLSKDVIKKEKDYLLNHTKEQKMRFALEIVQLANQFYK